MAAPSEASENESYGLECGDGRWLEFGVLIPRGRMRLEAPPERKVEQARSAFPLEVLDR